MRGMNDLADGEGLVAGSQEEHVVAARRNPPVYCLQCGYNLHGLALNWSCPECGLPVEKSQPLDLHVQENVAHVRRLRNCLAAACLGHSIYALLKLLVLADVLLWTYRRASMLDWEVWRTLSWIEQAAQGAFLVSWFLLAVRLPDARETPDIRRQRLAIRVSVVAILAVWAIDLALWQINVQNVAPKVLQLSHLGRTVLLLSAQLVLYVAGVLYLARLARLHACAALLRRTAPALWAILVIVPLGMWFGSFLPWMSLALLPLLLPLYRDLRRRVSLADDLDLPWP